MNGDAARRELIGGGFFNFNGSSEYFLLLLTRNILISRNTKSKTLACQRMKGPRIRQRSHYVGLLWNRHGDIQVRTMKEDREGTGHMYILCASSGFQSGDRISTLGSERASVRLYPPPAYKNLFKCVWLPYHIPYPSSDHSWRLMGTLRLFTTQHLTVHRQVARKFFPPPIT